MTLLGGVVVSDVVGRVVDDVRVGLVIVGTVIVGLVMVGRVISVEEVVEVVVETVVELVLEVDVDFDEEVESSPDVWLVASRTPRLLPNLTVVTLGKSPKVVGNVVVVCTGSVDEGKTSVCSPDVWGRSRSAASTTRTRRTTIGTSLFTQISPPG